MSRKFYESSNIWVWLLVGWLVLLNLFLYWRKKEAPIKEESQEEDLPADENEETKLIVDNYTNILNTLRENDITNEPFIQLVAAQAMHETGYFTSDLMFKNNNYFGMRQPKIRETLSVAEKGGYASFDSLSNSAADYVLWTRYVGLPLEYEKSDLDNVKVFVKNLKSKGYFEDTVINYQNGVAKALNVLKNLISAG